MASFGRLSQSRLATCHKDLVRVAHRVVKHYDCAVICGARSDAEQAEMFAMGRSKLDGVTERSKHQVSADEPLSLAIDLGPYFSDRFPKIPWDTDTPENRAIWYHFNGRVLEAADELGIAIRSGADWDGDRRYDDQSFHDLPHYELV